MKTGERLMLAGGLIAAGAMGAGTLWAAQEIETHTSNANSNDLRIPNPTHNQFAVIETHSSEQIRLKDSTFTAEQMQQVRNVVGLMHWNISDKWNYLQLSQTKGLCIGFMVRDSKNLPHFLTADHCVPRTINSKDGKTYSLIDETTNVNIYSLTIELNGRNYDSTGTKYYDHKPYQNVPDIIEITSKNLQEDTRTTLPLADVKTLHTGDSMLFARYEDGEMKIKFMNYLGQNDKDGTLQFISLENPDKDCAPGASGSIVVNTKGEIVSLVRGDYNVSPLSANDVNYFGLESRLIGIPSRMCFGASPEQLRNLIESP